MGRSSHSVLTATASFFAVYPDGRRCSVTADDAERNLYNWRAAGVRIITVITNGLAPVFDEVEYE